MTTTTRKTPSSSEVSQLDKFKEAARELECDESERHFRDRLKKLVVSEGQKKREP